MASKNLFFYNKKTPSPNEKPTYPYENHIRFKQKRNSNPINIQSQLTARLAKFHQKSKRTDKKNKKGKCLNIFDCVADGESFEMELLRKEVFLGAVIVPWGKDEEFLRQYRENNSMMAGSMMEPEMLKSSNFDDKNNNNDLIKNTNEAQILSILKDQVFDPRIHWGPNPLAHIRRQKEMTKQYTLEYILDIIPSKPLIIRKYIEDLNQEKFRDRWFLAENMNSEKFDYLEEDPRNVNKKSDVLLELFKLEYPNLCGLGKREYKEETSVLKQNQYDSAEESPSSKDGNNNNEKKSIIKELNKSSSPSSSSDALNNFEKTFLQTSDLIIYIFQDEDQLSDDSLYYHITSKAVLAIDALSRSTNDYPFTSRISETEFISWYKVDMVKIYNETFQQFNNMVMQDQHDWKLEEFMYSYLALISFTLNSEDYNRKDDDDPITDKYTYRPIGVDKPKHYFMFCDKILVKILKNYDRFQYRNFQIPEFNEEEDIEDLKYGSHNHNQNQPINNNNNNHYYPNNNSNNLMNYNNQISHIEYDCSEGSYCKNSENKDDGISSVANDSSNDDYDEFKGSKIILSQNTTSSSQSNCDLPSNVVINNNNQNNNKSQNNSSNNNSIKNHVDPPSEYHRKLKKFRQICSNIEKELKDQNNLLCQHDEERYQTAKDDYRNIVQNLYDVFRQAHLEMRDVIGFK